MTQSWSDWLADTNRTGTSPAEVIAQAVHSATGEMPAAAERLMHGEINEVYDITTSGGQRVIVRIGHRTPSLFPAERWAIVVCV